jgi:hypothetical protein
LFFAGDVFLTFLFVRHLQANLATALSGAGPFTVFAPTNDAFIKALGALKLTKAQLLDLPTLASVLKFHVVAGKITASQLSNGLEATTLEGSKLKFDLTNGVKVNGATVTTADLIVDNGVIHVIDTVLLPPVKPKEYLANMPGVLLPTGLFDPLGFADGQSVAEIKRLRESEIIHGRVAMLAALGFLVGESGFTPLFDGEIRGLPASRRLSCSQSASPRRAAPPRAGWSRATACSSCATTTRQETWAGTLWA